jgi:hypothetical protein
MRITISKTQHRALLQSVCAQLGTDKPSDALEHVLNCWMVGNVPPSNSSSTTQPIEPSPHDDDDEFAGLDSL